jgi:hypothetical protein
MYFRGKRQSVAWPERCQIWCQLLAFYTKLFVFWIMTPYTNDSSLLGYDTVSLGKHLPGMWHCVFGQALAWDVTLSLGKHLPGMWHCVFGQTLA